MRPVKKSNKLACFPFDFRAILPVTIMVTHSSLDALVIGAGPTGLALASDLLRHGLRVRIVDKADAPTTLSKAVVLMPRSLEEFQMRKLSASALAEGEKVHSFSAYNHGEIIFRAEYARVTSRYNFLLNIPQTGPERILRDELIRLGGHIEWKTTLESFVDHGDHVTAILTTPDGKSEQVDVPYLLGCGGAHSPVRHGLNFEFIGEQYHDNWLLADVDIDWKLLSGRGYAFFADAGLLAVFPMPQGRYRIYIVETESRALGREPKLEDITAAVERIIPGMCVLRNPGWMSEFHCHHRRVKHYRKGNVFIGGDAAHIHSPETGLGMNTGIQDSFNLAWKIAYVRKGASPSSLLDTYDTERSYVGKQVVGLSDFAHKLSSQFNRIGSLSRDHIWRFFSHFYTNHFKEFEQGLQVRIQYEPSAVVENHGHQESLHNESVEVVAGVRAVDGNLQATTDGAAPIALHDVLDPLKFRLMIIAGHLPDHATREAICKMAAWTKPVREFLTPTLVLASQTTEGFETFDGEIYLDPAMEFHYLYGAQKGGLFLIRPDGYVGFSSRPIRMKDLENHLRGVFVTLSTSVSSLAG